jgi:hypothetical protein
LGAPAYGRVLGGPIGAFGGALGGAIGAPVGLGAAPGILGGAIGTPYGRAPSTYQFGYGVQSGDYNGGATFGHNEERSAVGTVGQYHVNTPGSFQFVNYNVPH